MARALVRTWADTLRSLGVPRRAIAIALVVLALLAAQWWFRPDPRGLLSALVVTAVFLVLSPVACRVLLPAGDVTRFDRLALYGLIACAPAAVSLFLRDVLDFGDTLLTDGVNLLVIAALSAVGGWGLARDIELESGLAVERARATEFERQAERAELLALRSHLDPHFLFNTLGALAEWTREDPATAERGLLRLADLMRDVMTGVRDATWTLEKELGAAVAVWELHALRDDERFVHRIDVPEPLPRAFVPPLVLLPLVENAVKHGPAAGHVGTLTLTVRVEAGERLVVEVENPGAYGGPRAGGQGLELARRRLAQVHGDAARVDIGEVAVADVASRTRVTLELPLAREARTL